MALSLMVTSCALVTPPAPPPETFDLTAPGQFGRVGTTRAQILVKEPSALKSLDSERIVAKPSGSVVEYLPKAQWSDRLPKMVQSKLVEAFENSGGAGAVAKPGDGLVIDFQIISDIRAFEITSSGGNAAEVSISIKLLRDKNGKVLRSKIFTAQVPVSGNTNTAYVAALDAAFDDVAKDIVVWVLRRI